MSIIPELSIKISKGSGLSTKIVQLVMVLISMVAQGQPISAILMILIQSASPSINQLDLVIFGLDTSLCLVPVFFSLQFMHP